MLQAGKNTSDENAKMCDCGRATVFRVKKEMITSTDDVEHGYSGSCMCRNHVS